MDFLRSAELASRFEVLDAPGSTNDELVLRATGGEAESWDDFSVVVSDNQTAGRGRLGRVWSAPPGTSLAISILLKPEVGRPFSLDALGWIPLLAGLAMTRAVRVAGPNASLKWPNDVLIGGKKVCGILSELLPGSDPMEIGGVVVGSGLNLSMTHEQLPVDTATSLLLEGVERPDPDEILAGYLAELRTVYDRFIDSGFDAESSGLRRDVVAVCGTLGNAVRVQMPAAGPLLGTAVDIDGTGRLVVESEGVRTAVSAGDITHLRS